MSVIIEQGATYEGQNTHPWLPTSLTVVLLSLKRQVQYTHVIRVRNISCREVIDPREQSNVKRICTI